MQIVFQAALRRQQGAFDVEAVSKGIADKLVHRHPHVFDAEGVASENKIDTPDQVLAQWDEIKKAEKAAKGETKTRTLDGIPPGPALARAQKVGSRCGKIGFDWPGWEGSFAKVEEETREIKAAIGNPIETHAELGDLLLATVNLARKLGVDAEQALIDATLRFEHRFAIVEDLLAERGRAPAQSSLEEMDALWNVAKVTAAAKK
jgi:ATP diphosphatase